MCRVGDLKVWVTMMLNFRLKGYVSRQYRWTIRCGNGLLQPCPWTFIHKNLSQTFDWNWILFSKSPFGPPFRELRSNVHTPPLACRNARAWSTSYSSQLNFFRYLLRLRRHKRKSVEVGVFRKGWVIWAQISDGRRRHPPTTVGVKNRLIALSCGIKVSAMHCLVLSQSTRVTDSRTDRRTNGRTADLENYDFQNSAIIAAPCGKTCLLLIRTHTKAIYALDNMYSSSPRGT